MSNTETISTTNNWEGVDKLCFVAAGSLQGFSKSLSTQQKLDVLNSTLLAQVTADSKYSRDDVDKWHYEYTSVLKSVGWQVNHFVFQQYTPSGIFFELSSAVEKLLNEVGAIPEGKIEVGDQLLQTLKDLNVCDTRVKLFHKHSFQNTMSTFQVVQSRTHADSQITVRLAAFNTQISKSWLDRVHQMNSTLVSYLYSRMPTLSVKLFYGIQDATLTSEAYTPHRELVLKELHLHYPVDELIKSF